MAHQPLIPLNTLQCHSSRISGCFTIDTHHQLNLVSFSSCFWSFDDHTSHCGHTCMLKRKSKGGIQDCITFQLDGVNETLRRKRSVSPGVNGTDLGNSNISHIRYTTEKSITTIGKQTNTWICHCNAVTSVKTVMGPCRMSNRDPQHASVSMMGFTNMLTTRTQRCKAVWWKRQTMNLIFQGSDLFHTPSVCQHSLAKRFLAHWQKFNGHANSAWSLVKDSHLSERSC